MAAKAASAANETSKRRMMTISRSDLAHCARQSDSIDRIMPRYGGWCYASPAAAIVLAKVSPLRTPICLDQRDFHCHT
jgi:hypothetical protein